MSNPLPLFYKNIVPLSSVNHKNYYIDYSNKYEFAKKTNSTYIADIEFTKAAREYPIVFATEKENSIYPVVILGLDKDQNLFIDKNGNWLANYIPAYVRRYPFILARAQKDADNYTICVDDQFSGFNTNKKGEKLFGRNGAQSDVLKKTIEFLGEYNNRTQATATFCKKLKELDLLEPMKLSVKTSEGRELSMVGFMGVNRGRLKSLPPERIIELFKTDQLELIYLHLASLANVEILMQRLD